MIFRKCHNLLFYMAYLKNPEVSKDILLILTPYNFFSNQTNISILSFEPSGKIVFVYKYNNLEDFQKTSILRDFWLNSPWSLETTAPKGRRFP